MTRSELAMLLAILLGFGVAAVLFFTLRYMRYAKALKRGNRRAKPVWRPFWMN